MTVVVEDHDELRGPEDQDRRPVAHGLGDYVISERRSAGAIRSSGEWISMSSP
jgi:hypothetical protein